MSTITFPINNGVTKRVNLSTLSSDQQIPISYTCDTSRKWIYCNYKERLNTGCFGDSNLSNKCLNQVTVSSGTHTLFFSYQYNHGDSDEARTPFSFGVQIFNPLSNQLTFRLLKKGYGTNHSSDYASWGGVAGYSVRDFFASSAEPAVTINSNGSYWCVNKALPSYSGLFSGSIQFSVSSTAIVTVYIFKSMTKINGTATPLLKSDWGGQYSGICDGSMLTMPSYIQLNASDLLNGRRYFRTNAPDIGSNMLQINNVATTSDLLSIRYANPTTSVVSPSTPGSNLGNWGLIYSIKLRFKNDTNQRVTFDGYVMTETNNRGEYCVINNNQTSTDYAYLKGSVAGEYNAWNWLTLSGINPGEEVEGTYRFVLGTNSCGKKRHIFSCTPN